MLVVLGGPGEVAMPERFEVGMPDGVRLNVEVTGPTDAEVTAILLHGWTLDGRAWHRQVQALTEAPFGEAVRVVTYDARGTAGPVAWRCPRPPWHNSATTWPRCSTPWRRPARWSWSGTRWVA
ncbi:hypothetical protein NKG94_46050 [Micromonospora sp. M12]